MMIFAPVSITPDSLYLSTNFSLNRLADLDSPSKSSGSFRTALLNSLITVVGVHSMGTVALSFPGVRANGMVYGTLGAGFAPPPPGGNVPPPPPMAFFMVAVEEEMDLVDVAIFGLVTLGSRSLFSLLIKV